MALGVVIKYLAWYLEEIELTAIESLRAALKMVNRRCLSNTVSDFSLAKRVACLGEIFGMFWVASREESKYMGGVLHHHGRGMSGIVASTITGESGLVRIVAARKSDQENL